ncbi:hypothetical protein [Nocardia heshunensis]
MKLPKLRRSRPALVTAEHPRRLAWRMDALSLDYPNARTTLRRDQLETPAIDSGGSAR